MTQGSFLLESRLSPSGDEKLRNKVGSRWKHVNDVCASGYLHFVSLVSLPASFCLLDPVRLPAFSTLMIMIVV